MLLGDTDEIPTPSVASVIASPPTKYHGYHVDLVNLWKGVDRYIGGDCIYSPTHPGRNKRPAICRYVPGAFDVTARKHVQLHPKGYQTILCESVKQIHYKFANWPRWTTSPQSKSDKYRGYLAAVAPQAMPQNWLWMWDADAWAASLPQPVAVVGNGANVNAGREIDAHPYVIRINNWRTDGYEDRVGWRTDKLLQAAIAAGRAAPDGEHGDFAGAMQLADEEWRAKKNAPGLRRRQADDDPLRLAHWARVLDAADVPPDEVAAAVEAARADPAAAEALRERALTTVAARAAGAT
jgi:hypothetical protein